MSQLLFQFLLIKTYINYDKNMSFTEYQELINHIKFSHKNQFNKLFSECKNQIINTNLKCYCRHLKKSNFNEILKNLCIEKCIKTCFFCQFCDELLIDFTNNLPNFIIRKYFSHEFLVKKYKLLNNLINIKHSLFTSHDILNILMLDTFSNIKLSSEIIESILKNDLCQNIFTDSTFSEIEIKLIKKLLSLKHITETYSLHFNFFVFKIIKQQGNILNLFKNHIQNVLNTQSFMTFVLTNNSSDKNYYTDEILFSIIDNLNIQFKLENISVTSNILKYLFDKRKVTNVIQIISNGYKNVVNNCDFLTLNVIANNIFQSIFELNTEFITNFHKYKTIKIIYHSTLNNIGLDIGGLSRDFFTNFFLQIHKYLYKDEYNFYRIIEDDIEPKLLSLIGNLFCRSVFGFDIIPSINFHPIIIYSFYQKFYTNCGRIIDYDELKTFLLSFDIDIIHNLFKIEDFNPEEFEEFLYLENIVSPDEYESLDFSSKKRLTIIHIIDKMYLNKNLLIISAGFSDMLYSVAIQNEILTFKYDISLFHKYISRNIKFNILGKNPESLESSLIISEHSDSFETNKTSYDIFKKVFLDILNDFNQHDIQKLKDFLKFWFGTHSILNFKSISPKITFSYMPPFVCCFKSSTCFSNLICDSNLIESFSDNKKYLKKYILDTIDSTLENQKLCDSINLSMQLM